METVWRPGIEVVVEEERSAGTGECVDLVPGDDVEDPNAGQHVIHVETDPGQSEMIVGHPAHRMPPVVVTPTQVADTRPGLGLPRILHRPSVGYPLGGGRDGQGAVEVVQVMLRPRLGGVRAACAGTRSGRTYMVRAGTRRPGRTVPRRRHAVGGTPALTGSLYVCPVDIDAVYADGKDSIRTEWGIEERD
jgi:hypothetical protein